MVQKIKGIFLILVSLILGANWCEAGDITATGGWSITINANDLVSGAGSNLKDTYQSNTNATVLNITVAGNQTWRVDKRRTDTTWHNNFTLSVQRTSDGTGDGSISGGSSFTAVETIDTQFFSGDGNRSGVNVRYQLGGVSVQIPPDTYSATVIFTVIET